LIRFLLNEKEIETSLPPGTTVLDLVRYDQHLFGTKIGCREGDCGACTVLVGELRDGKMDYHSMTSCLLPIGNINGKHIITVEGLNASNEMGLPVASLNPVQQAMAAAGATQCGFCTPGFVVSLAGFCLSNKEPNQENAIASIDGNICRCTGYKSIERAAANIVSVMQERKEQDPITFACRTKVLPGYMKEVPSILSRLKADSTVQADGVVVAGGTDLYVQRHETIVHEAINFINATTPAEKVFISGDECHILASCTVSDLLDSSAFNTVFPSFSKYSKLVSSTPIRNMATIAGNFINASPIGDLTIFFLALDATLQLELDNNSRSVQLRKLYKGYKTLDKLPDEKINLISFKIPGINTKFHFEKVSKRTHLDIASVNTAILLNVENQLIQGASISAGGVGPIPMLLEKASAFLQDKPVDNNTLSELINVIQTEISPISDARGSEKYKRLLLAQLIKAHFIKLFPSQQFAL
jgi:xanthine dehydrogenase small subunit